MRKYTKSITDPQNRDTQVEQLGIRMWSIIRIHRVRTSTQNNPFQSTTRAREWGTFWLPGEFGYFLSAGEHFGVDIDFAQSSGDEVGILASEIEDEDRVKEVGYWHGTGSRGCFVFNDRGWHCKRRREM
jgi:hypothetical protein